MTVPEFSTVFKILLIALVNGLFLSCHSFDTLDSVGPVVFVNILFRHGDRTPTSPYPNDPFKNASLWPVGWGQLTNEGKMRHYELGKWLKNRYQSLLGDRYSRDVIYIQSTDVDRTLMSAESNLAGMYPPEGKQVWNSALLWQPIPVHTIPETLDKVLSMKAPCPKYEKEFKEVKKSKAIQELNKKYKDLYLYLTLHSGYDVKNVEKVEKIYTTLTIEEQFNFTLPDWTKPVYPQPMKTATGISFAVRTLTDSLKRLHSGPLLKEMLQHFHEKSTGKLNPDRNVWVYSAHDTTVANFLNTLGVYNAIPPPFASTVLMELRRNANQQYFVTLLYRNSSEVDAHVLQLEGCDVACPLDKFKSLVSFLLPDDWDSECQQHGLFDLPPDLPYSSLAVFAMVSSTLLVFLLLISTSLYWYKHSPSTLYRKLATETL